MNSRANNDSTARSLAREAERVFDFDPHNSLTLLEKACKLAPNDSVYWVRKGNVEYALNQFDAALASWQQALKVNPNDGIACSNLGLLYEQLRDYHKAELYYRRATELSPNSAHVWTILGAFLAEHDQLKESLDCLEEAIRLNDSYQMAWANKGLVLEGLGRKEDALQAYLIAHKLEVDDVWTLVHLATCLLDLKRGYIARRFLKFAQRIEPRNKEVLRLSWQLPITDNRRKPKTSNPHSYKGSKELLDRALTKLTIPTNQAIESIMGMAFAFDIFGLPNGKKNPSRRRDMHMTRAPDTYEVTKAFRQVINPLLDETEKWLLDIPVDFANQPAIDAWCCTSPSGECAIVLYAGIFGGLFSANPGRNRLTSGPAKRYVVSARGRKSLTDGPRTLSFGPFRSDPVSG